MIVFSWKYSKGIEEMPHLDEHTVVIVFTF